MRIVCIRKRQLYPSYSSLFLGPKILSSSASSSLVIVISVNLSRSSVRPSISSSFCFTVARPSLNVVSISLKFFPSRWVTNRYKIQTLGTCSIASPFWFRLFGNFWRKENYPLRFEIFVEDRREIGDGLGPEVDVVFEEFIDHT